MSASRTRTVVAISASPAAVSSTARVADFVLGQIEDAGIAVNHLKIRDLPSEALVTADVASPAVAEAVAMIDRADGIVVATPIYKASYSGLLKIFLDVLPQFGLAGKTVLPIATGGSLAHALALDYGLRPVLQSMGVRHVVQAQFIPSASMQVVEERLALEDSIDFALREAIYHFRCSLMAGGTDMLLGHPRPVRTLQSA